MVIRIFGISVVVAIVSLVVAYLYGGWTALALCAILGVLEVSLSFDNAVINATVLEKMSDFWQKIFLTIGILIAVFGMRLLFPLLIVWVTAGLNPVEAFDLAMNVPPEGSGQQSYEEILTAAHPQIASFGGMFLFMLFLNFVLEEHEIQWLTWLERPLAVIGRLDQVAIVIAGGTLVLIAEFLADDEQRSTIMLAGILGIITYITVNSLGQLFHTDALTAEQEAATSGGPSELAKATGKAGFFLFLYLEVLDASFSFDGVIGAFAITADPIIIALGLGFIGAMFVRSITVYLVRAGTLNEYRYLEHGAHWAIGALAAILFFSIQWHINEILTGLVGVAFIGAAALSSVVANRREAKEELAKKDPVTAT